MSGHIGTQTDCEDVGQPNRLAAFMTLLEPACWPDPGHSAEPELPLDSLARFEGALAWESGIPRHVGPGDAPDWARDAWLAGWDDADARFCHADDYHPAREDA